MFSERLENLIKAALKDGVLTEQEKNAIIKRAQAEDEDIDEVDIYIQSLMQEKQQQLAKEAQEAETTRIVAQKKEREARMASELEEQKQRDSIMRKCPVCGGVIPALSNVCPNCQHVINSYETDEKMMKLIKKITAASDKMYCHAGEITFWEDKYRVNYFPLLAELEKLYGNLPKVQEFLLEQKRKRLNLLSNEFLEKIDMGSSWAVKDAEMTLNTIINTYGSMPEAQALIPNYQERLKKRNVTGKFKKIGCAIIIVIIFILSLISSLL